MKKLIIGALVAAVLLQIWQTVSWTFANVHGKETQFTEHQGKIVAAIGEHVKEGQYYVMGVPEGTTQEQMMDMDLVNGKPWATINYHPAYNVNMGMNMFRGFIVNLLSGLILCWILLKFRALNFTTALLSAIGIGFIGYFTIVYMNHIWFEGSTIGYLIDTVASWGLVGAWLGFYLPEKSS